MVNQDAAEFDDFCLKQYDQLVGATSLLCGDVFVAEELVQTALERTWASWDRIRDMDSPGGWTQQVAFNLARSRFRRRTAERRALRRLETEPSPAGLADFTEGADVRAALQGLPDRQREVLVHRFYAGRSVAQTAQAMGLTVAAAKQLSYRARNAVRSDMDGAEHRPSQAIGATRSRRHG